MNKEIKPVFAWAEINEKGELDKDHIWGTKAAAKEYGEWGVVKVLVTLVK